MSGAMRRIGEYLGLLEDTGQYDSAYDSYDDYVDDTQESPAAGQRHLAAAGARPAPRRSAPVADLAERRPRPVPVANDVTRIISLQPTTYNEARQVGEHFREGTPVIMNLTDMDDADAKRLVDFAAGLVFATRGSIERVANKVFLLSPPNVSVTAEARERLADSGFFNQS